VVNSGSYIDDIDYSTDIFLLQIVGLFIGHFDSAGMVI